MISPNPGPFASWTSLRRLDGICKDAKSFETTRCVISLKLALKEPSSMIIGCRAAHFKSLYSKLSKFRGSSQASQDNTCRVGVLGGIGDVVLGLDGAISTI